MAGGEGSRLWPLSTPNRPKPFLKVFQNKTLLELTIERLLSISSKDNIFIVIPEDIEDKVRLQLPGFPKENIIIEPVGRNTASCIALAARKLFDKDRKAVIGLFPADHIIINHNHFYDCIRQAERMASRFDKLVLLGLQPKRPSTGYGYIFVKEQVPSDENKIIAYLASGFKEKPGFKTAQDMIKAGGVLWNSGIYVGKANIILKEIQKNLPDVYAGINAYYNDYRNLKNVYETFPPLSIDYAVTENLEDFIALSTNIERIDVGNFNSFFNLWEKDRENNALRGSLIGIESRNNIIFSEEKPVAVIGINDMIIINAPDAILICLRDKALEVKQLQEKWKTQLQEN